MICYLFIVVFTFYLLHPIDSQSFITSYVAPLPEQTMWLSSILGLNLNWKLLWGTLWYGTNRRRTEAGGEEQKETRGRLTDREMTT